MAQFGQDQGFYNPNAGYGWNTGPGDHQQYAYTYDMDPSTAGSDFGGDQPFKQFDYNQQAAVENYPPAVAAGGYPQPQSYGDIPTNTSPYTGTILTPSSANQFETAASDFEDEPPLLEELGINFDHIIQKTWAVLNPFQDTDASILQDTDLAGPLVFCLSFGGLLLLAGKVHFNYIYGIGVLGCVGMYFLLNLMALAGVSIGIVISVLGYCLLPMVGLAGIGVLLPLGGLLGMVVTALAVGWCSLAASKLFVTALSMDNQQPLVAYPCAMVYGVFALLAVF